MNSTSWIKHSLFSSWTLFAATFTNSTSRINIHFFSLWTLFPEALMNSTSWIKHYFLHEHYLLQPSWTALAEWTLTAFFDSRFLRRPRVRMRISGSRSDSSANRSSEPSVSTICILTFCSELKARFWCQQATSLINTGTQKIQQRYGMWQN